MTSLGKAFILEEEGPLMVMVDVPAVVSRLVEEIEEGKEVGGRMRIARNKF
jgi:hypothetical protein